MLAQHVQVEKDQVPSQASDEEDVAYTINETKWATGAGSGQASMNSVCRMQEQSINISHVAYEHKIHFSRAHKFYYGYHRLLQHRLAVALHPLQLVGPRLL